MEGCCRQTFEERAVVPTGAGVTRTWKVDMKQV